MVHFWRCDSCEAPVGTGTNGFCQACAATKDQRIATLTEALREIADLSTGTSCLKCDKARAVARQSLNPSTPAGSKDGEG